ncbi:MAG: hypothetical protein WC686_04130 [Candidatus Shapirobacteria bacterium]|jgi:hypothetical protein
MANSKLPKKNITPPSTVPTVPPKFPVFKKPNFTGNNTRLGTFMSNNRGRR